jgi:hypothetical protein
MTKAVTSPTKPFVNAIIDCPPSDLGSSASLALKRFIVLDIDFIADLPAEVADSLLSLHLS